MTQTTPNPKETGQQNQQIIEYEIHQIPRLKYNTIRSFVDSSTKMKYPWNTPMKLGNLIEYIKLGRWRLTCNADTLDCVLHDRYGRRVFSYIRDTTGGKELIIFDEFPAIEIDYYSLSHLNTAVFSSAHFARPVRIVEILERLNYYFAKIIEEKL